MWFFDGFWDQSSPWLIMEYSFKPFSYVPPRQEQRHILYYEIGCVETEPSRRTSGHPSYIVLSSYQQAVWHRQIALKRQPLAKHAEFERSDIRRPIDRMLLYLMRQFSGREKVMDYLPEIDIDALFDLISKIQIDTEDEISSERLNFIFSLERIIRCIDADDPVRICAFWLLIQNRIQKRLC